MEMYALLSLFCLCTNIFEQRSIPPLPEWMADLARRGGDIPGAGADTKEKAERDARWTNDWADQLTVAIALREWTKAVELVEKGASLACRFQNHQ
jgi:hypothetical protein